MMSSYEIPAYPVDNAFYRQALKLDLRGKREYTLAEGYINIRKRLVALLSAHDLRDAGGWNSLAMPSRYVEAAKIANEGVNLGED